MTQGPFVSLPLRGQGQEGSLNVRSPVTPAFFSDIVSPPISKDLFPRKEYSVISSLLKTHARPSSSIRSSSPVGLRRWSLVDSSSRAP